MFKWWKKHTKDGLERPDPTPIEISLDSRPLTIHEQLARFVTNNEIRERQMRAGIDTFDEADDFDIEDEDEMYNFSPYEDRADATGIGLNRVQTRFDELKAGTVDEMDIARMDRAREALRPKAKVPTAPAQAPEAQKKEN